MSAFTWVVWAVVLVAQNFAFTFVSRARNSGSLSRHLVAGIASNGIWFIGQLMVVGTFMAILSGHFGLLAAVGAGLFYTTFTVIGSLLAHHYALKTEKGASRVGAYKDDKALSKEDVQLIRTRCLLLDNGDGVGTFTIDELGILKGLIAQTETTKDIQDETIQVSVPDATGYSVKGYGFESTQSQHTWSGTLPQSAVVQTGNIASPTWQPDDITKFPAGAPGQGAKL